MDVKRFSEGRFSGFGEEHPIGCWVKFSDFERVAAQRDALQLRLNAVEEENDRLRNEIEACRISYRIAENTANDQAAKLRSASSELETIRRKMIDAGYEIAGYEGSSGLYYSRLAAVANGEQSIEPIYRVKK